MIEPSPELRTWIFSRKAFDTRDKAEELMDYIMGSDLFRPNQYGQYEPLKPLTEEKLDEAIEMIVNEEGQRANRRAVSSSIFLERTVRPRCSFHVDWSRLPHKAFDLSSYRLDQGELRKPSMLDSWIGFSLGLITLHEAWFALIALGEETYEKNFLTWHTRHPRARDPQKGITNQSGVGLRLMEGIPGVYWGNYFNAFYVDWFGREKFETLPCVEKRWLEKGGIFFTTAETPFEWNTAEARAMEEAVKDHLGRDAFFDITAVREALAELEPIPEAVKPEQLQPPRRVPEFPFKVEPPPMKPIEEQVKDARRYFENQGFTFEKREGEKLFFRDERGGLMVITVGPGRKVEYFPKV